MKASWIARFASALASFAYYGIKGAYTEIEEVEGPARIYPSGSEGLAMREMMEEEEVPKVKAFMRRDPPRLSSDGSLEDALAEMIEKDSSLVLVIDGDELLGMVGDSDIGRLVAKGVTLKEAKMMDFIAACMLTGNQPCVQIRDEDSILNALRVMDLSNATNLVVVDKNDKVVGTISVLDALRGWKEKV